MLPDKDQIRTSQKIFQHLYMITAKPPFNRRYVNGDSQLWNHCGGVGELKLWGKINKHPPFQRLFYDSPWAFSETLRWSQKYKPQSSNVPQRLHIQTTSSEVYA